MSVIFDIFLGVIAFSVTIFLWYAYFMLFKGDEYKKRMDKTFNDIQNIKKDMEK